MTDKELLELAAKANWNDGPIHISNEGFMEWVRDTKGEWNPLTDDADAFRLAVKLNLNVEYDSCPEGVIVFVYGNWDGSPDAVTETFEKEMSYSQTRRAIVRAAAEIGKTL